MSQHHGNLVRLDTLNVDIDMYKLPTVLNIL